LCYKETIDAVNRLVIGFRPPAVWHPALDQAKSELRRRANTDEVRFIPPSEWVVAVLNLGEVRLDEQARLAGLARPLLAQVPNPLTLTGEQWIPAPNPTMPRSLAVGLGTDVAVLAAVAKELQALMPPRDAQPEFLGEFEFARLRSPQEKARSELDRAVRMSPAPILPGFALSGLEFLRASAGVNGPEWQTVDQFPFSG
jgi:hypothetical protein